MARVYPQTEGPGAALIWRVVLRIFAPALLVLLIGGFGLLHLPLYKHWQATREFPYQLDAEEGFLLDQALHLARGETIYPTLTQAPYTVGNYPPLFPLVYSLIHRDAEARYDSLPLGRTIVQIATHGGALMIFLIAALRTRRLLPALLGPLLFLGTFEIYQWSAYVRVDLPALALTLAGLLAFAQIRGRWGAALAGVLFCAAVYTRQTAVIAPAACALVLLANDRRRLAWLLTPPLLLGLGILAALQIETRGEFWRHVVTYNANTLDWGRLRAVLRHEVWFFYRWWIIAAGAGLIGCAGAMLLARGKEEKEAQAAESAPMPEDYVELTLDAGEEAGADGAAAGRGTGDHARGVFLVYAVLAVLSTVTAAKIGAAVNYFLEPLAAGAIGVPLLLSRLWSAAEERGEGQPAARRGERAWAGMCLIAVLGLMGVHWRWLSHERAPQLFSSPSPGNYDRVAAGEIAGFVRGMPGEVYSEEPIFTLMARKEVVLQPFIMSQLAREGRWDQAGFVAMLRGGRFAALVVTEDLLREDGEFERYTAEMAAAIRERYMPVNAVVVPSVRRVYYIWTNEQPAA